MVMSHDIPIKEVPSKLDNELVKKHYPSADDTIRLRASIFAAIFFVAAAILLVLD